MTMNIELHDVDTMPAPTLRRIAAALLCLAGDGAETKTVPFTAGDKFVPPAPDRVVTVVAAGGADWKIAPNDRPDAGVDVDPDPAQVFAGAGHAEPDPDPASVFGGEQGNAPGATSVTPSGTPPAPNSGVAMGGASTPANGVELDKHGLPWDVRIHASTKTKNKDSSWKRKPKVEDALVAQVEAELRAIMSLPASGNVGAAATPPANVPTPPPASVPGNVPPPPAIPTPPASQPTTQGGGASSPVAITGFAQLLPAVTNAVQAGTLTEARVAEVLAAHGVQVLPQLAPRADLVQSVAAMLFPAV